MMSIGNKPYIPECYFSDMTRGQRQLELFSYIHAFDIFTQPCTLNDFSFAPNSELLSC